jgi:hypothetical protein
MGILRNRKDEAIAWPRGWPLVMVAVTMLGTIGVVVSLFGSGGMLGRGLPLEKMMHSMGCGGGQKENENGDNAQIKAACVCGNWFSGCHGLCG